MQTDMDIQTWSQTVSTVLFAKLNYVRTQVLFRIILFFEHYRYLRAYYYLNQINNYLNK